MAGIDGLIALLIYLIIVGAILYVVNWIVQSLTLPQPVRYAILLLLSVITLVWLLQTFEVI